MIFVTVGNATQGFRRLLDAVDSLARSGFFEREPLLLQTGNNRSFHSELCQYKPFLDTDEFQRWIEKADLVIAHGGCGTLSHAIRYEKVPVVMPRRKQYGEHVNDHQMQLVQALASEGRIVPAYEPEDLPAAITEARRRNAQPVAAAPARMLELVAQAIEELISEKADKLEVGRRRNGR